MICSSFPGPNLPATLHDFFLVEMTRSPAPWGQGSPPSCPWWCSSASHRYICLCLVTHLRPTLCDPVDCSPPGSSPHGIFQAITRVSFHALLQGITPTQGLNLWLLCLLHCRQILYLLSQHGSPKRVLNKTFVESIKEKITSVVPRRAWGQPSIQNGGLSSLLPTVSEQSFSWPPWATHGIVFQGWSISRAQLLVLETPLLTFKFWLWFPGPGWRYLMFSLLCPPSRPLSICITDYSRSPASCSRRDFNS